MDHSRGSRSREPACNPSIRDLQDQLVKTRARAARLDRVKKDLDKNLQGARESYAKIVTERGILDRRKRELENDLGASRARGDILHAELAKQSQELDQTKEKITTVVGHRSALRALVSRLETQLQSAESKIGGLEDDFNAMIAKLEKSTGGISFSISDRFLIENKRKKQIYILNNYSFI